MPSSVLNVHLQVPWIFLGNKSTSTSVMLPWAWHTQRRGPAMVHKTVSHAISPSPARVIFHLCYKKPPFFIDDIQGAPHLACTIQKLVLCWPCSAWLCCVLLPLQIHDTLRIAAILFLPGWRASHRRVGAGLGGTASSCSKSVQRQNSPAVAVCSNKCSEAKPL